ncbi:MFS transporter [Micromonospora sp. M12]
MATEPLLAVLLLGELGFPPWQYGLAFAVPCVGGLIGSRLARRVVARHDQHRIIRTVGTLRAIWLIGLAVVQPGVVGLATVIAVEFAIIICMSLYNPVLATYRLEQTPKDRVVRTLSAWAIGSSAAIALLSALGGLLAEVTSPRAAITVAGLLILASPLLLPRRPALLRRHPPAPRSIMRLLPRHADNGGNNLMINRVRTLRPGGRATFGRRWALARRRRGR